MAAYKSLISIQGRNLSWNVLDSTTAKTIHIWCHVNIKFKIFGEVHTQHHKWINSLGCLIIGFIMKTDSDHC